MKLNHDENNRNGMGNGGMLIQKITWQEKTMKQKQKEQSASN
jgi:hypothetical protein